ncbi:MAG: hypothetical protein ABFS10_04120 [Bacteroidota bacterium]
MKKLTGFLIIILATSSCGFSQELIRLTPEAPEGHFEMGREYIALDNDQVRFELGFDGLFDNYLVFDAVVINQTPHPLTIDPSEFYYLLLDHPGSDSSVLPPFMALQPSKILGRYDRVMEARKSDKNINSIFGFVEAGVGILNYASAFLATEDPGAIVDGVFSTVGTAGSYMQQDRQIGHELEQITMEREVVGEEIMKAGAIPPGKVVSGYVYFPLFDQSGTIMFCFPVEDQLFQFVYTQALK